MMDVIRKYGQGWKNLAVSLVAVVVFELALVLPIFPLVLLFPDQLEGKADGARAVQAAAAIIFLLWAPTAAYVLGRLEIVPSKQRETR